MLTLVLGGARSGKSRFAEGLAGGSGWPVVYLATGVQTDPEMAERFALHRAQRPTEWRTVEEPYDVAGAAEQLCGCVALLDCFSFLVSNHLLRDEAEAEESVMAQIDRLARAPVDLIIVSNEVGWSLVPEYLLGRRFRDLQGRSNQRLAAVAGQVWLVVAGIPLAIKGGGPS